MSIFILVQWLKSYSVSHRQKRARCSGNSALHSRSTFTLSLYGNAISLAQENSIKMSSSKSPSAPSELPPYASTCSSHTQPLEQKVQLKWREPCDSSFCSTSSFTLGRGEQQVIDSDNFLPVLEGRLYLASFEDMPDAASGIVYIRLNKKLGYIPFCADFGPFNLGTTHHACEVLKNLLQVRIIDFPYYHVFAQMHMRTHSHTCACATYVY